MRPQTKSNLTSRYDNLNSLALTFITIDHVLGILFWTSITLIADLYHIVHTFLEAVGRLSTGFLFDHRNLCWKVLVGAALVVGTITNPTWPRDTWALIERHPDFLRVAFYASLYVCYLYFPDCRMCRYAVAIVAPFAAVWDYKGILALVGNFLHLLLNVLWMVLLLYVLVSEEIQIPLEYWLGLGLLFAMVNVYLGMAFIVKAIVEDGAASLKQLLRRLGLMRDNKRLEDFGKDWEFRSYRK